MDEPRTGSRLASSFIAAYLVFQVGLPLRYYLRDDAFDERFAWRMFSPIRMVDCTVQFTQESGGVRASVDPRREVADAWLGLMQRARLAVIDGYARHHCGELARTDAHPALYLSLRCMHPAGETHASIDPARNLCEAR
jgi:hypothetical protein